MASIKSFEDIEAWKAARELVRMVYRVTAQTKMNRDYEFVNQIRGAAISSMSNVAEGFSRRTDKDFARFLEIAQGSAMEVQSLSYVALDVRYFTDTEFELIRQQATKTANLAGGFHAYLSGRHPSARNGRAANSARLQTADIGTRHDDKTPDLGPRT